MANSEDSQQETSTPKSSADLQKDLEELENLFLNLKPGDIQTNFEYALLRKANAHSLDPEQLRNIFKEFYTEKRRFKNLDKRLGDSSLFSLGERLTVLAGIVSLIFGIIQYLPNQAAQHRTETERKKIEQDRANYEAWGIINNSRVDSGGKLIQASRGRITALQDLNNNRVPKQGLEVPGTLLLYINLSGADLYRANFQGTDLYQSNFSSRPARQNPWTCSLPLLNQLFDCAPEQNLQERRTELERADFRGAILNGAKFNTQGMTDKPQLNPAVDLFRADFSPLLTENLSEDRLMSIECFPEQPTVQCTRAVNTQFLGAHLRSANFKKANLKGANFNDANLQCASFRGAIFNSAKDQDPNLTEAVQPTSFSGANLRGADFRDLARHTDGDKIRGLSPQQIKEAKNWQEAIYSPDMVKALGLSPASDRSYNGCPTYQSQSISGK
jgi:uncharacterized protein YjbI with pentapeptide repeats